MALMEGFGRRNSIGRFPGGRATEGSRPGLFSDVTMAEGISSKPAIPSTPIYDG